MLRIAAPLAIVLTVSAAASAQPAPTASANPVSHAIQQAWDGAKLNLTESGDQMPEADFAYKPIASVRSFGAILAHVAGTNYVYCSAARGEKPPHGEDEFEKTATTKTAIVKALKDSVAYCDQAYRALTDVTAGQPVAMPFGGGKGVRADALVGNVGHLQEHYGNLVTYFRMKGMVPPSSRRQ